MNSGRLSFFIPGKGLLYMAGFFDQFREKVLRSVRKEVVPEQEAKPLNDKIALGVLLWVVADADHQFLPEEIEKIEEILQSTAGVAAEDLPVIMQSVKQAETERIDLYSFTQELCQDLPYGQRTQIIELLFRVACSDQDLAHEEEEAIREISGLFRLDHEDFINAKIKIKKEFGLDTAGL